MACEKGGTTNFLGYPVNLLFYCKGTIIEIHCVKICVLHENFTHALIVIRNKNLSYSP